jgi:hypothetical protein
MRQKSKLITDRKAYHEAFERANNLAFDGKKINFSSLYLRKAILSRSYTTSYFAGIREGFLHGLFAFKKTFQREQRMCYNPRPIINL